MNVDSKDQNVMPIDYIIELAKEAGMDLSMGVAWADGESLTRFAALVRADEQMKALESARTIGGDWAAKFEQEYLK